MWKLKKLFLVCWKIFKLFQSLSTVFVLIIWHLFSWLAFYKLFQNSMLKNSIAFFRKFKFVFVQREAHSFWQIDRTSDFPTRLTPRFIISKANEFFISMKTLKIFKKFSIYLTHSIKMQSINWPNIIIHAPKSIRNAQVTLHLLLWNLCLLFAWKYVQLIIWIEVNQIVL